MLVLEREEATERDLAFEIEPRCPVASSAVPDLELLGITQLKQNRIVRFTGPIDPSAMEEFVDPIADRLVTSEPDSEGDWVDVFCLPGVTDAEGEMWEKALSLSAATEQPIRCRAGIRHHFAQPVDPALRLAVEKIVGNAIVHEFIWKDQPEPAAPAASPQNSKRKTQDSNFAASPAAPASAGPRLTSHVSRLTSHVPLRFASEDELLEISRNFHLALDLDEMQTIAEHFVTLGREPTDVELQSIALTWSEHCSHKTFKSPIDFEHNGRLEHIDGLLKTYFAEPCARLDLPWVRSAFVDNAGVIVLDENHDLAFKVETHNHPSALEPYGGAHTGVGGVIRDVLAVSAEPIANTDVLCFGPPDLAPCDVPAGVFHPARTFREVVRGVADYGNNMGIPTVGGAILFDRGYVSNPLVFCGTAGVAPRGSHPREPRSGDLIVLLGGRTGRDGLHGATMSSTELDRGSVAATSVQIGAPITEKILSDVIPQLRDERLYHAITDCGAGGLCSAVGEMGEELGVDVDLARVPLKYEGLAPWEIWLSEAQERMVLAAPEENLERIAEICRRHDLELTVIGSFRHDGRMLLHHDSDLVADLRMPFLHKGRHTRMLNATWQDPPSPVSLLTSHFSLLDPSPISLPESLLRLLAHPNIASKESVIRRYDHEVQGTSVVKPLTACAGPSDAAVLQPIPGSDRAVVIAHGINPLYGHIDPHAMALLAVDEALRNLVAVGGDLDHVALLDNFCWGDVDDPRELGALVRAAQGCADASFAYGVPFISGKDSLRNTSVDEQGNRHSIPGTLLISAIGVTSLTNATTMDLKNPGGLLYLLGTTRDELAASHLESVARPSLAFPQPSGSVARPSVAATAPYESLPHANPHESLAVMNALHATIEAGLIDACHDLSEGGFAVAAAEMALAGRLGADVDLSLAPADTNSPEALLFAESPGRFLVEVPPAKREEFEQLFAPVPHACIGQVTGRPRFVVRQAFETLIDLSVDDLRSAWQSTLNDSDLARKEIGSAPRASTGSVARPSASASEEIGSVARPSVAAPPSPQLKTQSSKLTTPDSSLTSHSALLTSPFALVLTAAGVNCDRETVEACRLAGADAQLVHVNRLLEREIRLDDFGMLVLPGGFSYGDHLGAGSLLAGMLRHRLAGDLADFVASGRPVLGICNGFQILARLGLLGDIALVGNESSRFECRWVDLTAERTNCIFLRGLERFSLPIAHGEGCLVTTPSGIDDLLARAPLRYVDNPNGSIANIAGVANEAGNVFGLMPHPERFVKPHQHPSRKAQPAGLEIFRNAVRHARSL